MNIRTRTPNIPLTQPIPVQAKLSAAWTSLMFLVIYIDYFHLYQPGEIDLIRGGIIFEYDISGTLMSIFFVHPSRSRRNQPPLWRNSCAGPPRSEVTTSPIRTVPRERSAETAASMSSTVNAIRRIPRIFGGAPGQRCGPAGNGTS